MTPDQWAQIRTMVILNWGPTTKWDRAADLYPDVRALPYQAMHQAATDLRNSGRPHPPPPGELIGLTTQRTHTTTPTDRPHPDDCTHPITGITAYTSDDPTHPDYLTPAETICVRCLEVRTP